MMAINDKIQREGGVVHLVAQRLFDLSEQMFCFDSSNLFRRHDYSVDIIGGTASANYATDHKTFGGFIFPTKRMVYAIGPDNHPILDRVAVSIDIRSIEFE